MATSRTGTSQWKKLRTKALRQAQHNGITHCPWCKTPLNYETGLTPSSAEVDHIIPHSQGGQDQLSNTTVCCRRCNQSKGANNKPKHTTTATYKPVPTSRKW